MRKAIRTQVDEKQDSYSKAAGLDCSDRADMARQEFKEETDVNTILSKFGVSSLQTGRQPMYGEMDYDMDLQTAMDSVAQSHLAFTRLPQDLREKYPTMDLFIQAVNDGTLEKHLNEVREKKRNEEITTRVKQEIDFREQIQKEQLSREAEAIAAEHRKGNPPKTPQSEPKK